MRIELTKEQVSPKLRSLYDEQNALAKEFDNLREAVTADMVSAWRAAGGCQKCLGHERVVTWSTLDGPGWTEYGRCQDCTEASKLVGKSPASFWAGGYSAAAQGKVSPDAMLAAGRPEAALAYTYAGYLEAMKQAVSDEEMACKVERGKTVVVIKGRKVPKGVTGECFWIGPNRFGGPDRIGIRTADEETYWTAVTNVKVAA